MVEQATKTLSIIDADSHVTEPLDLWTSRVDVGRWGDLVPHVEWNESRQQDWWFIGSTPLVGVGMTALAGWSDYLPSYPPTFAEVDPAATQPNARLDRLDSYGITSQILYPNILGFYAQVVLGLDDSDLRLEIFRAYNDFISEFASTNPSRLVPVAMLPFWDIDLAIEEMHRAQGNGHRGLVFAPEFQKIGLPGIASGHWDRLFTEAEQLRLSINFHQGFAGFDSIASMAIMRPIEQYDRRSHAAQFALGILANARTVTDIIMSGLCDRFPRLNFVSVESGFGYFPYLLQALDWQWENDGCRREFPNLSPPSEVFRRQIYVTYWFEKIVSELIEPYAGNVMFSSDFPHATSLSPGPNSSSAIPSVMAARGLEGVEQSIVQKVLYGNAARVYHLE